MPQTLGAKLGEGEFAEIHAWAPGQVVKLFKPGFARELAAHEASMTRAAFAAGAPAPEVFGEVTIDGRFGIVLQHLDGPTLSQLTRAGTMSFAGAAAVLADLTLAIHRAPPQPGVPSLRGFIDHLSRHDGRDRLPADTVAAILALIDRLQPAAELCHGDLHPSNVIMTAAGPRAIDWTWSMRGPAVLDLVFSHIVLTEFAPDRVDDPRRPPAIDAALQAEFAARTDTDPAALRAAIAAYLPAACAFHLLLGAQGTVRERLRRRLEATWPTDLAGA